MTTASGRTSRTMRARSRRSARSTSTAAVGPAEEAHVRGAERLGRGALLVAPDARARPRAGRRRRSRRCWPSVTQTTVTSQPWEAHSAISPPAPKSASSGWAPTTRRGRGGRQAGVMPAPAQQVPHVTGLVEATTPRRPSRAAPTRCSEQYAGRVPDRCAPARAPRRRRRCTTPACVNSTARPPGWRRRDRLDRRDDARAEGDRVDVRAVDVAAHERLPARVARGPELLDRHVAAVAGCRTPRCPARPSAAARAPAPAGRRSPGPAARRRGVQRGDVVAGQRAAPPARPARGPARPAPGRPARRRASASTRTGRAWRTSTSSMPAG